MVLSAAINNPRSAEATAGPESDCGPTIARSARSVGFVTLLDAYRELGVGEAYTLLVYDRTLL